jgi:hypothetical protein
MDSNYYKKNQRAESFPTDIPFYEFIRSSVGIEKPSDDAPNRHA